MKKLVTDLLQIALLSQINKQLDSLTAGSAKEHVVIKMESPKNAYEDEASGQLCLKVLSHTHYFTMYDSFDIANPEKSIVESKYIGRLAYTGSGNSNNSVFKYNPDEIKNNMYLLCISVEETIRMYNETNSMSDEQKTQILKGTTSLPFHCVVISITKQEFENGIDIDGWYDVLEADYGKVIRYRVAQQR